MKLDTRRWLILLAGILANLCQGAAYASSVFAKPMLAHLGCMIPKMIPGPGGIKVPDPSGAMVPDMTKWALAFSINLACLPIGMLLCGKLADKHSSRLVVVIGGLLFGAGMFLAGFSNSLIMFYLTFGVMMGLGSGAAYGAIVASAVRWFPDFRGLASGLAVGALGFGSFVIPPVAVRLIAMGSSPETGVVLAFKVLGIAFLAIIVLASLVMVNPPADYKPAGFVPKVAAGKAAPSEGLSWTQMLAKGKFWLLYLTYACGAFSGLMIISQASPIAQSMTKDIINLKDPKAMAEAGAAIAALLGLANAAGRIFWGAVSDKVGRLISLAFMFLITAITMFMLPKLVGSTGSYKIAAVLIGLCFGGYLGTFPSLCADAFGAKNMAVNYGILFSGFSVAALVGPYVAAAINKSNGSYAQAFVVAGVVSIAGFLLSIILKIGDRKTVIAVKNQ
ncbi:MAG: OFA family MFS transporter [Armatimonadota bacterium]|nr:OFA family MFS transporter [bacterium]